MYALAHAPVRAHTSITLAAGLLNIPLSRLHLDRVHPGRSQGVPQRRRQHRRRPLARSARTRARWSPAADVTRMAQATNGTWVVLTDDEIAACTSPQGRGRDRLASCPPRTSTTTSPRACTRSARRSRRARPTRPASKAFGLLFAGMKARKVGALVKLAMRGPARYAILTTDGDLRLVLTADAVRQPLALDSPASSPSPRSPWPPP